MLGLVIIILFFLALSAFFSGSEIAFVSASKLGVEIKRDEGSRQGAILGDFYDKPEDFLGTMLVGNNIALVILTYFMTELLEPIFAIHISSQGLLLLVNTLLITVLVLLFGEFLPKTVFRLFANEALFYLAYPLKFFKVLLKVPTFVMLGVTNIIMRLFVNSADKRLTEALTRTDLHHYIDETVSDFNEDIDKEIFTNALNLNQLKVRDCLVPRPEIIHMDISASVEELVDLFKKTKVSRILISDGDVEQIEGYIHHQHLLTNPESIKSQVLNIPYVPETMNARDLMLEFINENTNIACVVDEFGGTAGIITLEDILEEIFGEIEDEHDEEAFIEIQVSENEFLLSGRLEISYINETFEGIDLPEGEYHTLSGYIVMTSGKIPENEGDIVEMEGFTFVIEKLSDTKIETVRLIKKEAEDNDNTADI
ncbi:MAG: putative hemolysin [Saprospiraceae bacterium]|jgi:putative hemolysin